MIVWTKHKKILDKNLIYLKTFQSETFAVIKLGMKPSILFTFLLLALPTARAEFSNAKCSEVLTGNDIIQVNRQWDPSRRACFISVHPRQVTGLKYRDYYFDNSGRFMVFNSYGYGPDSTFTGARDFFLFPVVSEYPDFSVESNGDVLVKMVSGHQLRISGKDFSLLSLSSGQVSEKPLSNSNNGGVEIKLTQGFWLDAGFRLGGLNISDPEKTSSFNSAASKSACVVKNKNFMTYLGGGDEEFKLTGADFVKYVKATCPKLGL
jgi:hypothetical protein